MGQSLSRLQGNWTCQPGEPLYVQINDPSRPVKLANKRIDFNRYTQRFVNMADAQIPTASNKLPESDNLAIGFKKEIILDQKSRILIESYCRLPPDHVVPHLYAVVGHPDVQESCMLQLSLLSGSAKKHGRYFPGHAWGCGPLLFRQSTRCLIIPASSAG